MAQFIAGQRWICETELDKGLGTVLKIEGRTVTIVFLATGETRTYSQQTAPLRRAIFPPGDTIECHEGNKVKITALNENEGIITYTGIDESGKTITVAEGALSNNIQLNRPVDRILSGQADENKWFELRQESLKHQQILANSSITGLYDCRTSLIPHQLYIANEVSRRFAPRILLADEVGLGKTIEACMIMQQQLITGRASRVLIIVPDPLVHQWLVELLRRFNLSFSLFDEERCQAIEESQDNENPFDSEQLVLCSLPFIVEQQHRLQQALKTSWDLVIVDEAHHLDWSEESISEEYASIEKLSQISKGLILLTATPEQLGKAGHFARLRLLDPQRFHSLEKYKEEESHYQEIAAVIDAILDGHSLSKEKIEQLNSWLAESEQQDFLDAIAQQLEQKKELTEEDKNTIIQMLLDRHGTGRILFRNTRHTTKGFPKRLATLYPLPQPVEYQTTYEMASHLDIAEPSIAITPERLHKVVASLKSALDKNYKSPNWFQFDNRIDFIIDFLQNNNDEKALVICANKNTAQEIEQTIRQRSGKRVTAFHEDLSLIERDRAASYFADFEQGAQALICSEIGSEGRNFQFTHHLILFDLPMNPDLLEQRIGRLDRIGQKHDIQIHVPYFENTAQAIMAKWYKDGVNAFSKPCQVGEVIYKKIEPVLTQLLQEPQSDKADLNALIESTQSLLEKYNKEMEKGRDRLLELNSCNKEVAALLKAEIESVDQDSELEDYMERVFDAHGIEMEEYKQDSMIIRPGPQMQNHLFHGLKEDGNAITYDRATALANEDMQFITWSHPFASDAIEMTLANEQGNTSVISIKNRQIKPGSFFIETSYVVECIFPEAAAAGIQMPRKLIHNIFNAAKNTINDKRDVIFNGLIEDVDNETTRAVIKTQRKLIRDVLDAAELKASKNMPLIMDQVKEDLHQKVGNELDRLISLKKVNPNIREEEVNYYLQLQGLIDKRLAESKLRLDAIRIVITH